MKTQIAVMAGSLVMLSALAFIFKLTPIEYSLLLSVYVASFAIRWWIHNKPSD